MERTYYESCCNINIKLIQKYKYLIVSILVALSNMIFSTSYYMSLIIVIIQCIILGILFIKRHLTEYICYFLIFMSFSLEYPNYYEIGNELYGFKGTRIAGVSIGTLCILPVFLVALINIKQIYFYSRKKLKMLNRFTKLIYFMLITAVIIGGLQIVTNDNNVANLGNNVWFEFANEAYTFFMLVFVPIFTFYFILVRERNSIDKISRCLYSIMAGVVVAQILSAISPLKGKTWDSPSLLVSFLSFYAPYIILFFAYKNRTNRKLSFFLGLAGCTLSALYTITSGGILIIISIPFFLIILFWKEKRIKELIIMSVCILFFFSFGLLVLQKSANLSVLLEYKLKQALSVVQIWKEDWITSMPPSARFRFEEFYNILREYVDKPWFLLLGKGIMGTCRDFSGHFSKTYTIGSAFTDAEWMNRTYYSMHESLNVLFLTNGLVGLSSFIMIIKNCIKYIHISPFIIIGTAWYLFHYTYSFSVSMFGIMCLMVGLYKIDIVQKCNNQNMI